MKRNGKILLSLLALGFLLSCTQAPKQIVDTQVLDQLAEKGKNSTVLLLVPGEDNRPIGSGFFVEPDKIATNIHVVAGEIEIRAKLASTKKSYSIEGVTAFDLQNDLVILKVAGEGTPLTFGKGRIGEEIFVVGYPLGREYEATRGKIHGIRNSDRQFRLTTKVVSGNSGGPVLNSKGEVIGIAVRSRDDSSEAISSNALEALLGRSTKVEALTEWQKRGPVKAYRHVFDGNYIDDERPLDAIKKYNKAIELYPSFVEAYSSRGVAKNNLEQYLEAIKDYDKVIEFIPDHDFAYRNRGKAWSNLGRYKAAIQDFNIALKLMPDDAFIYRNRGLAWFFLGGFQAKVENVKKAQRYYEAAKADLDEAIRLDPVDATAYLNRGAAWFRLGSHKTAIEDFDKAIELNPADATAYLNRGAARSRLGNYKAAIEDFDKAIELNPDHADAYINRGVARFGLGESENELGNVEKAQRHYKAAIEDFDKAIELNPDDAEAYNNRGVLWNRLSESETKLGNAEEAQQYNEAAKADFGKAQELASEVGK